MAIQLSRPHENPLYVALSSVIYFSGPFEWMGSNFEEESQEKCLELIHKKVGFQDPPNPLTYKLYIIEDSIKVQIIAAQIGLYDRFPFEYPVFPES